jgi:hypothetical protein
MPDFRRFRVSSIGRPVTLARLALTPIESQTDTAIHCKDDNA